MNFKELCEQAAEEVNGKTLTFSSVDLDDVTTPFDRRVIRAVRQAHRDIEQYSRHWRFLDKRGALFDLEADVGEYTWPQVDSFEEGTLYLTKSGSSARWPVELIPYDVWQERERSQNTANSIPYELSRTNDPDVWVFWPAPSVVYTLNGNLRYKHSDLVNLSDEPYWDDEFHELVVWLAVKRLESRVRTRDEIVSGQNASTAQSLFTTQWDRFCRQYLPDFGCAPTLV